MNVLNLDEAIAHSLEVASTNDTCPECAAEHVQLALWLIELRQRRTGVDPREVVELGVELETARLNAKKQRG